MRGVVQKSWTGSLKTNFVEYLLVAGGGSAGSKKVGESGGGGAGGVMQGLTYIQPGTPITVTVGGGGAAAVSDYYQGKNGDNSVFGNLNAIGGGAGAGYANDFSGGVPGAQKGAFPGGSGGGMAQSGEGGNAQGTFRQGNAGGRESKRHVNSAGGGGGAGTVGNDGHGNSGGNGGNGVASYITGTITTFGGGGAGASQASSIGAIGGEGGGGASHGSDRVSGVNGTVNTGGGSGGCGDTAGTDSTGGSGIVVVSYPDIYANAVSTLNGTYSTTGSGSLSFDGSSQYLTYASNAAWALGSTFTLEFWTYPTAFSSSNKRYFDTSNNGSGGFSLRTTNTGVVALDVTATGQTTTNLSLNTWTHVAVVVTSGTLAIYFNGVAQALTGGGLTGINVTGTLGLTVGNFGTASTYAYQGYMTNIRVVKGVAVYTGNFTPSTVPLQTTQPAATNIAAITGTSTGLLLNSVSGSSCADISTNGFGASSSSTIAPTWNQLSPFATGLGYKNRVYKWTSSGTITF